MTYLSDTIFKLQMSSWYLPFLRNTSCAVEAPREVPQVRTPLASWLWWTLQSFPVLTPRCPEKLRGHGQKKRNSKNQELLSSFIVYLHHLVTEATSSFTFWTCNSATANAIGATDYGAADNGATDRAKDAREIRWPGGRQRNQHGATALNNSGNGAQVVFKPRLPLGIFVSDVQAGRVSGVLDGQAKEQGLEAWGGTGWCGDDSACRCR